MNNEVLHGNFYERQTGDLNITMDMFRQVHAVDAHPALYLNDYGVVSYADSTVVMFSLRKNSFTMVCRRIRVGLIDVICTEWNMIIYV